MPRILVLVAALALAQDAATPPPAPAPHPELAAGMALVKSGAFEEAVLRLEAASRSLEGDPRWLKDLARAYLYLGVAYLELEQELSARARFREALLRDRTLRPSADEFSEPVRRVYDSARLELGIPEPGEQAPAAAVRAAPSPAPVVAREEEQRKKRRFPVLLVLGGGAAAVGGAVALGGGGSSGAATTTTLPVGATPPPTLVPGPSPTPEPSPTASPEPGPTTTTTTTTTTTMPPPACAYDARPSTIEFDLLGGNGECNVETTARCSWTAADDQPWITITSGTSGTGNGIIRFRVDALPTGEREGRVFVQQDPDGAACRVRQRLLGVAGPAASTLSWTSHLDVAGGTGQVVLNGTAGGYHGPGLSRASAEPRRGMNRIEAVLVSAAGRPGTWRFDLAGGFRPGTLRVVAGRVRALTPDSIVFQLAGSPGERVVFSFQVGR